MDGGDRLLQRGRVSGRGQPHFVDVAFDVEVGVVFPERVADPEGGGHDPLAIAGDVDETPAQPGDQNVPGQRTVEDADPADVQRALVGVDVEEGRVER